MYRFDYDLAADCLHIHVAGFWQPQEIPTFSDALDAACRKARTASYSFDAVIHSGDFPVQSNDVADLMTGVMQRCIDYTDGYVAVVVASLLNKLQVERTLVHPRIKPFMTEAEASAWLSGLKARGV